MNDRAMQHIYPALRYQRAHEAIDFLERAFGFTRHAVFEGPDGSIAHAELRLGTATVGLNSAAGVVEGNPWTTVRAGIYVALPDAAAVDAHHARASEAGAVIARRLQDTTYGAREYSVWDVDRHLWSFGTYAYAPAGEPSLFVGLHYGDGSAAIDWLERVFGCVRLLTVPADDGGIVHAELEFQGNVLMLSSQTASLAGWAACRQVTYVHVPDPDAHFAHAREAGATILQAPADTSYGARAYYAQDPEGGYWGFSTYRPSVR